MDQNFFDENEMAGLLKELGEKNKNVSDEEFDIGLSDAEVEASNKRFEEILEKHADGKL
ncbi:MAG: hypothetical protein IKQ71_09695 [Lachnospiraceae bacterium]|nr:hypothetical protein [Lachnospiraceae bacterium]